MNFFEKIHLLYSIAQNRNWIPSSVHIDRCGSYFMTASGGTNLDKAIAINIEAICDHMEIDMKKYVDKTLCKYMMEIILTSVTKEFFKGTETIQFCDNNFKTIAQVETKYIT